MHPTIALNEFEDELPWPTLTYFSSSKLSWMVIVRRGTPDPTGQLVPIDIAFCRLLFSINYTKWYHVFQMIKMLANSIDTLKQQLKDPITGAPPGVKPPPPPTSHTAPTTTKPDPDTPSVNTPHHEHHHVHAREQVGTEPTTLLYCTRVVTHKSPPNYTISNIFLDSLRFVYSNEALHNQN